MKQKTKYKLPIQSDIPKELILKKISIYFSEMSIYELEKEFNRLFPDEQIVVVEDAFFDKDCDWRKL